jgi:type IV secretory pathway TraG/TraD family ATPase VirD4
VNTAGDWLQSGLGVLSFTKHYSLYGLYRYLFDAEFHANIDAELEYRMEESLSEHDVARAESYLNYQNNIFAQFEARFVADVRATVSQILGPFQHPELVSAFCDVDDTSAMESMMNDVLHGTVYLVDLPLGKWGLGGKTAYTILKLRFFATVLARTEHIASDATPVFFMCDEFQEIISANPDGLSDLSFWDKSREAKCVGIVSWQGVSSIYASIGNRDVADAILQNFRQRFVLRTEDENTLRKIESVLGHVPVERVSKNESVSGSMERDYSKSRGHSRQETDKSVTDPQLIRQLGPNEAIALMNIGGYAVDDVIRFTPIYVN